MCGCSGVIYFRIAIRAPLSQSVPHRFFASPRKTCLVQLGTRASFPLAVMATPRSLIVDALLPLFFDHSDMSNSKYPCIFITRRRAATDSNLAVSEGSTPMRCLRP